MKGSLPCRKQTNGKTSFSKLPPHSAIPSIASADMNSPDNKQEFFQQIIALLSTTLDLDEKGKLDHGRQVALLSHALATQMNLANPASVYLAGLFHDIGGIGIKNDALHLPLQGFHDVAVREHASRGSAILANFHPFVTLAGWVRDHHERYDGSGFPSAKSRQEISTEAGILHLANLLSIYFPSRHAPALENVLPYIEKQSGRTVSPAVATAGKRLFTTDKANLLLLAQPDPAATPETDFLAHFPGIEDLSSPELACQLLWLIAHVADAKHQGRQQNHSIQVAFYSHHIAKALHRPELDPMDVLWAALLHNIGLTAVPIEDLQLDFDIRPEISPIYRFHPKISAQLIEEIPALAPLTPIIAAHHEHYNGSGFPQSLQDEEIPLASQIISMADAYQWLAGNSMQRNEQHLQGLTFIEKGKGTLFAPDLADAALSVLEIYGQRDSNWLQNLTNIHAFFNTQLPENLAAGQEEAGTKSTSADTLSLFPRQWHLIRLSNNLKILSGATDLSTLSGVGSCLHLNQALSDSSYGELQQKLLLLGPETTLTLSLQSRFGKTLELIFTRQKNGYDLLARGINTAPIFQQTASVYYRNFLNHPEAELLLDNHSLIKEVNQAFLDCFQIPKEILLQTTITALFEPFLSPRKFMELQLFFHTREAEIWSDEFTFTTGTKSHQVIEATLYRIGGQECEQTTYLCRIINISARKKFEQEIIERDNELQAIVHNTTGMTGEGFFKALLYQFMMLTKAGIGMIAELTDDNQALVPHVYREGHKFELPPEKFSVHGLPCQLTARRGETYFPRRLREFFPDYPLIQDKKLNSYWGLPLRKQNGITIGVLAIYNHQPILHSKNIQAIARIFQARLSSEMARIQTERVLLEKDRLLEKQNSELTRMNQLKSDMIAITSHDLKAPLAAIIGYASLLEEYTSTMNKEKTLHYTRRIQNEGQKQLTFINKLLDLYRIESGAIELSLEPYRLDILLGSCLNSLREVARSRAISFSFTINGEASPLSIDHLRIAQVFTNLLSNAIKFSPEQGKISVNYEQDKELVTIHIADQGPGVNEEEIHHIFDRYYMGRKDFKIRPEGSGLGLYIVRNIVELHGGTVSARNLSPGGSCFTIQLPVSAVKQEYTP